MKNIIAYDVETTIYEKGSTYSQTNKLVYVGFYKDEQEYSLLPIEYNDEPYGNSLKEAQSILDNCDLLVGFNLKFDIGWGKRYGLDFSNIRCWDCQLVHFMLQGQADSYPSLNGVCEYYGIGSKLDEVKAYWDAGIDTPDIPRDILEQYLKQDISLTLEVYKKQVEEVNAKSTAFKRLVSLHNQDLIVLQEIEYNGLLFDEWACLKQAEVLGKEIEALRASLYASHSIPEFNTESGDHLSALLYGGTITIPRKEVVGVYKTGDRKGQEKLGWKDYSFYMPRLVKPLVGSELKKEGYWATGADVLKSLKPKGEAKKIVDTILELAKLEKIVSTYYLGLPALREKMNWGVNMLHGNLNQCVARTGRLSSTKPNLQNISGDMKGVFGSRYAV
jgi:DNA polymerase I-like protein with 3'-5' exonuclease and polymerase domains